MSLHGSLNVYILQAQVIGLEQQVNDSDRRESELLTTKASLETQLSEAKVSTMMLCRGMQSIISFYYTN